MATRGRKPLPTSLKLLKGTAQKCRMNAREPQPNAEREPHCPEHLDERARTEWNRLLPILREMRVLTEADYIALANLCQQYSILIQAQDQLNRTGLLISYRKTPDSPAWVQQSPLLGIITAATTQVNALCREFGLTPSSRTRVQTASEPNKKAENPWARLGT